MKDPTPIKINILTILNQQNQKNQIMMLTDRINLKWNFYPMSYTIKSKQNNNI